MLYILGDKFRYIVQTTLMWKKKSKTLLLCNEHSMVVWARNFGAPVSDTYARASGTVADARVSGGSSQPATKPNPFGGHSLALDRLIITRTKQTCICTYVPFCQHTYPHMYAHM